MLSWAGPRILLDADKSPVHFLPCVLASQALRQVHTLLQK
jgi:hypothetical protein